MKSRASKGRWQSKLSSAVALLLGVPIAGLAQDLDGPEPGLNLGVSAGLIQSDNIQLRPDNERSGTIGQAGLDVRYFQQSRRVRTDLDVNAAYQHYFNDEFDADVAGGANGTMVLGLLPQRLEWFIQDNFGQVRVDPLAVDTPENRENINFLTTGPDFMFRLGRLMAVRLTGRYSETDYEISDLDGERYLAGVSLSRQIGTMSSLSLNVQGERLELENQTLAESEYDRREAFIRFEAIGARTHLATNIGATEIESDQQVEDGLLIRLELRRRISAYSTLSLDLGRNFSDSGNLLRDSQARTGVVLDPSLAVSSGDALEHRFAVLGWATALTRTSYGANVEYDEQKFQDDISLDRNYMRYGVYATRWLNSVLQGRAEFRFSEEEFDNSSFDADEKRGTLALSWAVGAQVELRFQYDIIDRNSSVATNEYTENRLSLFAKWNPLAGS